MAPDRRVPRVPRAPRPTRPEGAAGVDSRAAARTSPGGPEATEGKPTHGVPRSTHDAAPSPPGARVTVGDRSKVTLLDPVRDGTPAREAASAASNAAEPSDAPAEGRDGRAPGPFGWLRPGRRQSSRRPSPQRRSSASAGEGTSGQGSADVLAFPERPGRRRRRRALIGAAVGVALVAALFAVLLFTPLVAVRAITVQGTHLLSAQKVESALAPLRGRPLVTVGSDEVGRLLGQFVEVKAVKVRAVPPETLAVQIVERVPVALVKQDSKLLVVDGDAVVLGEAKDTSQYAVPVIDSSAMPMGQSVFRSVTAVLAALPADILGQLATASAQSADSVELKLSDGRTVVWGNADERELKAKVLAALMKASENPEKGRAPARVFDVSTPRHPVTR